MLIANVEQVSAHFSGVSLSGFGTATIDGVLSPGEWDGAGQIPVFTGAFAGSTFYVMNDANNLYFALEVVDSTLLLGDSLQVRFDNTHNGVATEGDDQILARQTATPSWIDSRFSSGSWTIILEPLQHGTSAIGSTGSKNFIEASKPLNSGDSNDFSLSLGDTVGFCLRYVNDGTSSNDSTFPALLPGGGCVTMPQSSYADIIIATSEIKPIGGELLPLDTTMVLLAGTHAVAAWMIPVIVSGIGFAIVIARKF